MDNLSEITISAHRPDFKEKLFFFFSGMIMSVPLTVFTESFVAYLLKPASSPFITELVIAALIAPLIEEFSKAYPLFYRHGETERSILTLGFFTGLGFGLAEFFVYILAYGAPVYLRIFALFFHATNTSIVAYGIARKKPFRFYLIAVLLHFVYNFSAFLGMVWLYVGIPALILSFLLAVYFYFKTRSDKIINY